MHPARVLIVRDPRFREHEGTPGHPERPARIEAIERALDARPGLVRELPACMADTPELLPTHAPEYLAQLEGLSGERTQLDPDTYMSPRSLDVARLAAGSAVELARRIVRGEAATGFALIRPPGHHAERTHAQGFCLLNHVAITARQLRRELGLERIAIVDWDVHHGNGTQHQFEDDRDLLFVSSHRFPFYPGTGALHESGRGAGEGSTVNLPLPAGCGDAEYLRVFAEVVVPTLREFRPEMILVSAGFDAHVRDPLGGMRVTTGAYAQLAALLRGVADECCDGRLLCVLEGGYDLDALSQSVVGVLEVLAAEAAPVPEMSGTPPTPVALRLIELYREAHGRFWKSLRPVTRA